VYASPPRTYRFRFLTYADSGARPGFNRDHEWINHMYNKLVATYVALFLCYWGPMPSFDNSEEYSRSVGNNQQLVEYFEALKGKTVGKWSCVELPWNSNS